MSFTQRIIQSTMKGAYWTAGAGVVLPLLTFPTGSPDSVHGSLIVSKHLFVRSFGLGSIGLTFKAASKILPPIARHIQQLASHLIKR